MIDELLPRAAATAELFGDSDHVALFASEELVVARAVEKRRRAFASGRGCARRALFELGVPVRPLLPDRRGAPSWPAGVVGSITHCDGYTAAAVALQSEIAAIGIDAEPNRSLPELVLRRITGEPEQRQLRELAASYPAIAWDRLLFSAKEAAYKAWYALQGYDLSNTTIVFDGVSGEFTARPRIKTEAANTMLPLSGRWLTYRGLLVTAIGAPQESHTPAA
jgi:4'-phosphopantetheinyl transferase EntD